MTAIFGWDGFGLKVVEVRFDLFVASWRSFAAVEYNRDGDLSIMLYTLSGGEFQVRLGCNVRVCPTGDCSRWRRGKPGIMTYRSRQEASTVDKSRHFVPSMSPLEAQ